MLEIFLDENYSPDIVCLTEHHVNFSNRENLAISGYNLATVYARSQLKNGGVAVFCRKEDFTVLHSINNFSIELHCEVAAVYISSLETIVIVFYRSPSGDMNIFLQVLNEILSKIKFSQKVCLCGDFNVHFNFFREKVMGSLCDLLSSYSFKKLIYALTRGENCLDNIFSNFEPESLATRVIG